MHTLPGSRTWWRRCPGKHQGAIRLVRRAVWDHESVSGHTGGSQRRHCGHLTETWIARNPLPWTDARVYRRPDGFRPGPNSVQLLGGYGFLATGESTIAARRVGPFPNYARPAAGPVDRYRGFVPLQHPDLCGWACAGGACLFLNLWAQGRARSRRFRGAFPRMGVIDLSQPRARNRCGTRAVELERSGCSCSPPRLYWSRGRLDRGVSVQRYRPTTRAHDRPEPP